MTTPPAAATVSWSAARILERRLPRLDRSPTRTLLFDSTPGSALPRPASRSVSVAEDRSAEGVRDQTGPEPRCSRDCSRDLPWPPGM